MSGSLICLRAYPYLRTLVSVSIIAGVASMLDLRGFVLCIE